MTNDATIVFAMIGIAAVLMTSNRVRFDIIAFCSSVGKCFLAIQIHRALITRLAPSMIYGMSSSLVRNTAAYVSKTIRPWLEYA